MNKCLDQLTIPGFFYNADMTPKAGSFFYDKEDSDGDSWIEIIKDFKDEDKVILIYVIDGEIAKVTSCNAAGAEETAILLAK